MKQRFLILSSLILLILISYTLALEVELISPQSGAVYVDSNTVSLKCKPSGNDLVQLALIDISGTMETVPPPIFNPTNNTEYTFTVENLENGVYTWNCQVLSSSSPFQAIDPTDRQVTIDFQNDPPTFSGTIANQTWDQDTSKDNAFDLDDYFSDTDSITYSVSGNTNINTVIASDGQVSFSQPSSWWGIEVITFRATDVSGFTDSNEITLTVNQGLSPSNNEPEISGVPDQTKEIDDTWTLNLDEYINDDEDSDDDLIITVSGVDTSIFTVSVDQSNNELDFEAEDEGTDDFIITVEDTDGATDSQTITITIEEEIDDEFDDEFDDDQGIDITAATPGTSRTIIIKPGESKKFEITTNTYDIVWYIDNSKQDENSRIFTYEPEEDDIGEHIIKVIAGEGTDIDMKTWDIKVESENNTISTSSAECGNNKIDENETCLTCPEDAQCEDGEYCDEGECKKKALNKITGFATKSKNFILDKWYYPTLIFAIILLIIIGTQVIKVNKKSKKSDDPLEQFSDKLTLKQRIQRKLREWDRKRTLKKQNKTNFNRLKEAKKEHIRATAPNIDSIVTFINQRLSEGNNKREVIKALKRNGWSRKHIKLAFKKIKNDSGKPT